MKSSIQKSLTGLLAAALFSTVGLAETPKNLDKIVKDVRIMSKVLESAVREGVSKARIRVNGEYLARQGILLRVTLSGAHHIGVDFDSDLDFAMPPMAPLVPELPDTPGVDPEEIQQMVDEAMEQAEIPTAELAPSIIAADDDRSQRNAVREQRRQLAREARKIAEKVRAVRREARKLSEQKRQDYLEQHQKELDALRLKNRKQAQALRDKLLQQRRSRMEHRNQLVEAQIAEILDSFCEYVSAPRNLPTDEYVTLQIRNAVITERGRKDRYFVLTKKQLSACSAGSLNGVKLGTQALSYTL